MRMILKAMHIANFKGITALDVEFGAACTRISGSNGAGKSTIADAFSWVLFNKDSHGNAPGSDSFHEKPLDEHGQERHNLDTSVELDCLIDGRRYCLKRVQRESWVKKRGSAVASFSGNVSSYFINDVEVKQSEFKSRISQIVDEQIFMLLGTLKAFNQLDWRKRREQLVSLSDIDVDAQLLATPEFADIARELEERNITVDELRKVLSDQRKRINDELKMMPVRIDEARAAITEHTDEEIADAHYIIKDAQDTIARIDRQIAEAGSAASSSEAARQKIELQMQVAQLRQKVLDAYSADKQALFETAQKLTDTASKLKLQLRGAQDKLHLLASQLVKATQERDALRDEYRKAKDAPLGVEAGQACPTCGQVMPSAMIDELLCKAKQRRKDACDLISVKGKECKARCEEIQAQIDAVNADIALLPMTYDEAQKAADEAMEKLRSYPKEPDYSAEPCIAELEAQIADIQPDAAAPSVQDKVKALEERRAELQAKIADKQRMLAQYEASQQTRERLKAHEARQAELGVQMSRTELLIELLEQFIQERCMRLEDSINSHFNSVRWKLFDTQINGGIVDTCVAMIPCNGAFVSYETANTAAQINACIEIIDALGAHYDVRVPLFIDGAESVINIEDADTQMITLSVSNNPVLTIDTEEEINDGEHKLSA